MATAHLMVATGTRPHGVLDQARSLLADRHGIATPRSRSSPTTTAAATRSAGERRARRRVPARGGALHGDADPGARRHRPGRGGRGRGVRGRRRAVAGEWRAAEPGRLDHDDRPQSSDRPAPQGVDPHRPLHRRPPHPRPRLRALRNVAISGSLEDLDRSDRRRPRRPAAADVPVLSPGPRSRRPGGARCCACSVDSTRRRSPAPTSCRRRRWRSASCAPNASFATTTRPTGCRVRPNCRTGCHAVLTAVALIFTEGAHGDVGRRPGARRSVERGDPPRAGAGSAAARRARGRRPARPHAAHRRSASGAPGGRRHDGAPRRPGPLAGTGTSSPRGTSWCGRACAATARARSSTRPPSPPSTPTRRPPRRPTGTRSSPSTTSSRHWHPNAVVALNRAVAIGERDGASAGLAALDASTPTSSPTTSLSTPRAAT